MGINIIFANNANYLLIYLIWQEIFFPQDLHTTR